VISSEEVIRSQITATGGSMGEWGRKRRKRTVDRRFESAHRKECIPLWRTEVRKEIRKEDCMEK